MPRGRSLGAGASAAAAFFGAAFFLAVVASAVGSSMPARTAASYRAFLSGLGSATRMGGGAASPLNFCQSPVTRKMAATASVGCAPTPSQYCARSVSTSM